MDFRLNASAMGSGASSSIGMLNSQSHTLKKSVHQQKGKSSASQYQVSDTTRPLGHYWLQFKRPKRRMILRWAQNRFPKHSNGRNPCRTIS